jgi:hypothetical protein
VHVPELVAQVRRALEVGRSNPAAYGLIRLPGGMNHDVFAPIEAPELVVKVFGPVEYGAAELSSGDLARLVSGRKAMACFWLELIGRRRHGLPTTKATCRARTITGAIHRKRKHT